MQNTSKLQITRRQAIATLGGGAGALLSSPWTARTAPTTRIEIARGSVFEDQSRKGSRQQTSPGIANVMVSNGRDVVLTDKDGLWTLPVETGDCIFVIKPPHWSPIKRYGAPAAYYLYQPDGTPPDAGLATPKIDPTGALPKSIDFALMRTPEPERFEALLVADTQAASAEELNFVRADLLSITETTPTAFAIHHGDVMGDDLSLLPGHMAIIEETGIPWYHCPGNHDMNLDSSSQRYAFEAWKQHVGPTHSALQYAGATFILLNNVDYLGRDGGARGGRGYQGRIGESQLQFVKNVLCNVPSENLVVVSMHIPLVSFENPECVSDITIDRSALMQLLSERSNTVSFSGHSHTTEHHYLGRADGFTRNTLHHHHVLTAACGSWWSGPQDARGVPIADSRDGSPKGVHVLTIEGNSYATRFVPSSHDATGKFRTALIGSEHPLRTPTKTSTGGSPRQQSLLVDVFDGGPRTRVMCQVDGQEGVKFELKRTSTEDPYIVASYALHKHLCKPWVIPARSSHIWCAALPEAIEPGLRSFEIHVIDEYGQSYEMRHGLDVSG
jgi:hypothetical protein